MSEMVERVARAMLDSEPTWTGEHWDDDRRLTVREFLESTHLQDAIEVIARDAARAAIEAMREPTDGMVDAGYHRAKPYLGTETMAQAYRAMITAALGEGE